MNKQAIEIEEQIISLFPNLKTEVYKGCILKEIDNCLSVYPLYCKSDEFVLDRIRMCEEIGRQKELDCSFHIAEYTNYYLAALLKDNGYWLAQYGVVGELYFTENDISSLIIKSNELSRAKLSLQKIEESTVENVIDENNTVIGKRKKELLFVLNGAFPCESMLNDVLQFSLENRITRVLVAIPKLKALPEYYKKFGFQKVYLYRCYQKQGGLKNGFTK